MLVDFIVGDVGVLASLPTDGTPPETFIQEAVARLEAIFPDLALPPAAAEGGGSVDETPGPSARDAEPGCFGEQGEELVAGDGDVSCSEMQAIYLQFVSGEGVDGPVGSGWECHADTSGVGVNCFETNGNKVFRSINP